MNLKEFISAVSGTTLSAIGTAIQTQEVLEIISMIITIIGATISFIVVPIISWWKHAKADGKITTTEMKEGIDIIQEGIEDIKQMTEGEQNEKD